MPPRAIDPASLQGEALRRWYMRSPDDLEKERQARYDQRYGEFFAGKGPITVIPPLSQEALTQSRAVGDETSGGGSLRNPLKIAQDVLHDFQNGPKIQRPNTLETFTEMQSHIPCRQQTA